jgi:hypothetical protein
MIGSRNRERSKPWRYRLEPLQECRLAAALVLLMSVATVSVMAGTQLSRQATETSARLLRR